MPPRKQKQVASASASVSSNEDMPTSHAMVPTKTDNEQTHTPERSPEKRSVLGITEAQKQALMDNLQLEVTERARKLRAQYALQAQGLRARLEMRVNRIPQALRKRNIQDLLDENASNPRPKPAAPLALMNSSHRDTAPNETRQSLKRTSEYFNTENKENTNAREEIPNPKKRVKTTTTAVPLAETKPGRPVSRKGVTTTTTTVLSPKSHNQRLVPRSPLKSTFGEKTSSAAARNSSPAKSTTLHNTTSSSRAQSRQTKRPATAQSAAPGGRSRDSEGSATSAGTTIVTKPGASKTAATRKAPAAKVSAATTKRVATSKKEPIAPAPAAGGRTLRKRG